MKKELLYTISGILAIVAPFLCCFGLPLLAVLIGGSAATAATSFAEQYAPFFWLVGAMAIGWGVWRYVKKSKQKAGKLVLQSTLTCPNCGFQKVENMPTDACQFFYPCEHCKTMLKPKPGDCCVYCSYGSVKCPPVQAGENCC
jgi:hypothetical protein